MAQKQSAGAPGVTASDVIAAVKLRRTITVHGADGAKQIDEIALKLPSGRLMLRLGEPFTTKIESDGQGGSKVEFKVVPALASEYLAEMTGINADLLGQLHPLDVRDLFDKLITILRPTEG